MEIRESFVSVKVAKLLREKGFNEPSIPFNSSWEQEKWFSEYFVEEPNPNYVPSVPFDCETFKVTLPHVSLSLATKWLSSTTLNTFIKLGQIINGELVNGAFVECKK